jgi:hypothetical protein
MYLKYSPCKSNTETIFTVKSENLIIIDGEEYEFDVDSVAFPSIYSDTNGVILKAYRQDSKLYITILRKYTDSCPWDDTKYHEVLV